jgi:hypothetical protein
MRKGGSLDIN